MLRHFAYYDTSADRIVLLSLSDNQRAQLTIGTRAGCWLGPGQFVAAGPKQMKLFSVEPGKAAPMLMRGPCLPRSAQHSTSQVLFCTRDADPQAFSLVKMKILTVQ